MFENGGRVSDYWKVRREQHPSRRLPCRAIAEPNRALEQVNVLNPTGEEIEEYGTGEAEHGEVAYTDNTKYHSPRLHDTWGAKQGGRVHIDIGSGGGHLMLDRYAVWRFIEFIKRRRER